MAIMGVFHLNQGWDYSDYRLPPCPLVSSQSLPHVLRHILRQLHRFWRSLQLGRHQILVLRRCDAVELRKGQLGNRKDGDIAMSDWQKDLSGKYWDIIGYKIKNLRFGCVCKLEVPMMWCISNPRRSLVAISVQLKLGLKKSHDS